VEEEEGHSEEEGGVRLQAKWRRCSIRRRFPPPSSSRGMGKLSILNPEP